MCGGWTHAEVEAVVVVKASGTGISCVTDSSTRASHWSRLCHTLWPLPHWRCLSRTRSAQACALRPQAVDRFVGDMAAGL